MAIELSYGRVSNKRDLKLPMYVLGAVIVLGIATFAYLQYFSNSPLARFAFGGSRFLLSLPVQLHGRLKVREHCLVDLLLVQDPDHDGTRHGQVEG